MAARYPPAAGGGGLDRRALIKRVVTAGAVAWSVPVILDSLASPAAAASGSGCLVYVFRLDRSGNSGNASVVLSDASGCASTVTGLADVCTAVQRVTVNGSGPAGTVTYATSGFTRAGFGFSFALSTNGCVVVGRASTAGTSGATACAATVPATSVPSLTSVAFTVPSAVVVNARAWAYVIVRCG